MQIGNIFNNVLNVKGKPGKVKIKRLYREERSNTYLTTVCRV
jgi:hypothetical protein